jgi:rapamycin-insensitive companion of mTOR
VYRNSQIEPHKKSSTPPEAQERSHQLVKLTDQFLAILVMVLTKAGLCDVRLCNCLIYCYLFIYMCGWQALTCLLEETRIGSSLSRKATLLLAEILALATRVLPMNAAAGIQVGTRRHSEVFSRLILLFFSLKAIPAIFSMATDYNDGEHRIVGTSALSAIESFNRNRTRLDNPAAIKYTRPRYVLVYQMLYTSNLKY